MVVAMILFVDASCCCGTTTVVVVVRVRGVLRARRSCTAALVHHQADSAYYE